MVTLAWIKGYFSNYEKMQKKSIYVQNRLKSIADTLRDDTVTFRFIEGRENPADYVTRSISPKRLSKTNYFEGPGFLSNMEAQHDVEVTVPGAAKEMKSDAQCSCALASIVEPVNEDLEIEKYSSFKKLVRIYSNVYKFINILKSKINNNKLSDLPDDMMSKSVNYLVRVDQQRYFPDVIAALERKEIVSKMPNLVLQMNLFLDENGIIRVKGKFKDKHRCHMLLHNNSHLTVLIIRDIHEKFMHAGCYTVIRELRKSFWVLKGFSSVRKILRNCVPCKRVNERPIKLNQNDYRESRIDPPKVPFSSIFIDYIGPINMRMNADVKKVWIMIITCLWSRAVSLEICFSADVKEFLRTLQLHIYNYGMFSSCMSDLGSQITAGTNILNDFLNEPLCIDYFKEHGIERLNFSQYPKGNSSLGSLVESMVKQVKHLIVKSIGKLILDYQDFQLLISKARHIVNRRPVAFNETLQSPDCSDVDPITPEMLLFGRELVSINVIPQIQTDFVEDFTVSNIKDEYCKLRQAIKRMMDIYSQEFLTKLAYQAVNKRDRYKPLIHNTLSPGDVVLLVENNTKRSNYPMGVIKSVTINSLGEVTSARVMKGKTREVVFRHSTSLIPLLSTISTTESTSSEVLDSSLTEDGVDSSTNNRASTRTASRCASRRITNMYSDDLV